MSQFGKLVRKLREKAGLSQTEVAERIESHKGYVCGIEKGSTNPPSERFIKKYARLFHYDLDTLLIIAHVDKAPKRVRWWFDKARKLLNGVEAEE